MDWVSLNFACGIVGSLNALLLKMQIIHSIFNITLMEFSKQPTKFATLFSKARPYCYMAWSVGLELADK